MASPTSCRILRLKTNLSSQVRPAPSRTGRCRGDVPDHSNRMAGLCETGFRRGRTALSADSSEVAGREPALGLANRIFRNRAANDTGQRARLAGMPGKFRVWGMPKREVAPREERENQPMKECDKIIWGYMADVLSRNDGACHIVSRVVAFTAEGNTERMVPGLNGVWTMTDLVRDLRRLGLEGTPIRVYKGVTFILEMENASKAEARMVSWCSNRQPTH